MDKTPYAQLKKGSLILASPEVESPAFARSVILVCEHGPTGSFGLVLNRPLQVELPEDLLDLKMNVNPSIHIRSGGPIQPSQMMLLHDSKDLSNTLSVCDEVFLGGDLEFLQQAMAKAEGPSVLLCFGYAGWGPGLLEREYLSGGWILADGMHKYIFKTSPEKLWRTVLKDKGGKYTSLSLLPDDLSLN